MAERKGVAHWLWTAKTCCAELPASFYGRMARRMMPVHGRHPPCNPSGRGLYPLCGPGYQDVGAGNVDERKRRLVMQMRMVRPARGASMARHGCAAPERAARGHAAHETWVDRDAFKQRRRCGLVDAVRLGCCHQPALGGNMQRRDFGGARSSNFDRHDPSQMDGGMRAIALPPLAEVQRPAQARHARRYPIVRDRCCRRLCHTRPGSGFA